MISSELLTAIKDSNYPLVKSLMSDPQGINEDYNGTTILSIALTYKNFEIIELLLQKGANANKQSLNHWYNPANAPLHDAVGAQRIDIIQLLLDHRADINIIDDEGKTPLHHAALYGNINIIKLLLNKGANPNIINDEGLTPLHICLNRNDTANSIQLIQNNADVNYAMKNGPYAGETILLALIMKLIQSGEILKETSEIKDDTIKSIKIAIEQKIGIQVDDKIVTNIIWQYIPELILQDISATCGYIKPDSKNFDISEIQSIYGENSTIITDSSDKNAFFSQANILMQKYTDLHDKLILEEDANANKNESFATFAKYFRGEGDRFPNQEPKFYKDMKEQLEHIYLYLLQMPKDKQKDLLNEMSRQLLVCGPGIFNSINQYYAEVKQGDITVEVAKYRKIIVEEVFVSVCNELKCAIGDKIHVQALVIATAQEKNYEPLGGREQLEQGDQFTIGIANDVAEKNIDIVKKLDNAFKEKYNILQVIDYVEEHFLKELKEALSFDKYNKIDMNFDISSRNIVDTICERYGVNKDNLFILDDNDDNKANLNIVSIENSIYDNLFKSKIAKTHQIIQEDGSLLQYINGTDKLHCWDNNGNRIETSTNIAIQLMDNLIAGKILDQNQLLVPVINFMSDNRLISNNQYLEYIGKLYIANRNSATTSQDLEYINIAKLISNACKKEAAHPNKMLTSYEKNTRHTRSAPDVVETFRNRNSYRQTQNKRHTI